jgi:Rrf2 family iron-sulfur cluster assembly transcriptional regulator
MRLSKSCTYALRAAVYLALRHEDRYVPIRQISENLDISYHFLTKTLQTLTSKDILTSYRGPSGGVGLARPAEQISVLDVINAMERPDYFEECLLGFPGCGESKPCPLHDSWQETRGRMQSAFKAMSLGELAEEIRKGNQRISSGDIVS